MINKLLLWYFFYFFFYTAIEASRTGPQLQQQVRMEWKTGSQREGFELLFMSYVLNDLMMLLRQTCPTSLSASWFYFGSPPVSKQKLFSWFSCLCLLILLQPRCQTANNKEAAQFCSAVGEWVMFNLCHVKINNEK